MSDGDPLHGDPLHGDLLLEGALVLGDGTVHEPGALLVGGGEVRWSGPRAGLPAEALAERTVTLPEAVVLLPGPVDLHVHGAAGADASDADPRALETICRVHAAHGTTALCPTVLTAPPETLLASLETIRRAVSADAGADARSGARILGANLEGPFLNPARAGAQPREHLRPPDPALLEELLDAGGEALRIVTLAPELPGALELVERLVDRGVVVAMGHTNATHAEALAAVEAGCRLTAHAFNAMRGLHHREPGALGAALDDERVMVEVIADGIHVSAPALRLAWKLKGPASLCLVTDCTAALEAPAGQARLGDQPVQVSDGAVRLPDGTLAGSSLTMERALANLVGLAGVRIGDAARAAAGNPSRLLELPPPLAPGSPADLLLLDRQRQQPRAVLVRGEVVCGSLSSTP